MGYVEFDADEVMKEFGDAAVAGELATIVRADLGTYAETLAAAHAAGNVEEVRRVAHAIKGAAGNVAAREVCSLAAAIDNGLRAGQREFAAEAPRLVAACGRLGRELGDWLDTLGTTQDHTR